MRTHVCLLEVVADVLNMLLKFSIQKELKSSNKNTTANFKNKNLSLTLKVFHFQIYNEYILRSRFLLSYNLLYSCLTGPISASTCLPSTTLPSLSTLQALIISPAVANNSKQCDLDLSLDTRTCMFSNGIIPLGSLSCKHSQTRY